MKNNSKVALLIIIGTSVSVLGLATGCTTTTTSQASTSAKGGGTRLIELTRINTLAEAEALETGDAIAMVCSKCKSAVVNFVTQDSKLYTKMIPGEKHFCPGCNSTIEVVGHGKQKTDVVKHVCKACGDDSAFCCATKRGSGPTTGMDQK